MLKLIKYRIAGAGQCISGYTEEVYVCGGGVVLDLAGAVVPNAVVTPQGQCPSEAVASVTPVITSRPHEFKNVTIPAGESIWTVPITAQSAVSRFQITVRNKFDSDVMLRAVGISPTQFKITVPLEVNNVIIFANPIETSSS